MSTAPVVLPPAASAEQPGDGSEHFERPTMFGRLRWWFEESPMAFIASVALAVVLLGLLFLLRLPRLRPERAVASVALQAVQAEQPNTDSSPSPGDMQIEQVASGERVKRHEEQIELPDVPQVESPVKPLELLGNQADSDRRIEDTTAALREAGDLLRKMLERNQSREGVGEGSGRGTGQLDPDSTPGRQARWIITYPTLPQGEYERMLDRFRIELAFLESDRRTLQYLASVSGVGKKYSGDANDEERMFWYWMGQNRLRELDDAILRKHGLEPTSEVVHLYTKELERDLAKMEREYLHRKFKTAQVELIAQTNFKILSGGPGGWHIEVTGILLK